MIYHYPDSTGKKQQMRVAGEIVISYPSEHIYLVRGMLHFLVYYGLQTTSHETLHAALEDFHNCCKHNLTANGEISGIPSRIAKQQSEQIQKTPTKMVDKNCKHCGKAIKVRQADLNRGWGKFCSKSCKAKRQEQKTGQYSRYLNRQFSTSRVDDSIDDFDGSWDAHNS